MATKTETRQKQTDLPACRSEVVHEEAVALAGSRMPAEALLYNLADFFKVLGDSTRVKILSALAATELCVCDLSTLLNMSQSAVSHQLRVLRQANLVRYRREGKIVYYALLDQHVESLLGTGIEHLEEL